MKFQVIKDKNTVMHTESVACLPDKDTLTAMQKVGYKFKIDGKSTTIKQITELNHNKSFKK